MQKIAFVASMVIAAQAVGTVEKCTESADKIKSPINIGDATEVTAPEQAKKLQLRGGDFGFVRGATKSFNNKEKKNSMPLQGNGFLYIGEMGNNDMVEKHVEVGDKFIPWNMAFVYPAEHLGVCTAEEKCLEIQISFSKKSAIKGNRNNDHAAKVMSLFVKTEGKKDNAYIETLKVSSTKAEEKIDDFDFGAFMNSFDVTDYITYTGNCDKNEATEWILVRTPQTMSVNQGEAIANRTEVIDKKTIKVIGNARPKAHEDNAPDITVHNNRFSSNALAFSAGLSVAATLLFAAF